MNAPRRIITHAPELEGRTLGTPRQAVDATPLKATTTPAAPKVRQQVVTVLSATARWLAAGCPMTSAEGLQRRKDTCGICPHWKPSGWLGAGRCGICGCSGVKPIWATESCPDKPPRWLAEYVDK